MLRLRSSFLRDSPNYYHYPYHYYYFVVVSQQQNQLDNQFRFIQIIQHFFLTHIFFTNSSIGGELWAWFLTYVTNRSRFVSINGCNSHLLPVESRVPQGSILGPLLFIIYMNDIPRAVAHSKVLLFADYTKYFRHIKGSSDMQLLQHNLNCLSSWSTTSLLPFHSPKVLISHLNVNLQLLIASMAIL